MTSRMKAHIRKWKGMHGIMLNGRACSDHKSLYQSFIERQKAINELGIVYSHHLVLESWQGQVNKS